ncbi:MAG: leucyl aminopeptidase family protein [Pseudomonadota bacterium]
MYFETDPAALFAEEDKSAIPIHAVTADSLDSLDAKTLAWAKATGFAGKTGQQCLVPGEEGLAQVLFGLGSGKGEGKDFAHAKLARTLPSGTYGLGNGFENNPHARLAWAMGGYEFTRYSKGRTQTPVLANALSGQERIVAEGVFMARDLINIPANDMGPDALETAFRKLGDAHGAKVLSIVGDDLLTQNFPMVHAVGRACTIPPRVLDLRWGRADAPKLTLVGKGVTFDTGGLNIKPGNAMALMKKDMGGAANVMGLAHMVMASGLNVRLRLIVGAVENSIAGNAFRPGDILQTRKGITVEIGNTDAEGRLVLGDCLAWADEESPDLLLDMATLTGAARVALGPELAPFYTHDDGFAEALSHAAQKVNDPVWRMPLWAPYQSMLKSSVADVNHISTGGFAGSITAALFLDRFVEKADCWGHFDIYGWVPKEKPWATVGGEALAIRALFAGLSDRFSS